MKLKFIGKTKFKTNETYDVYIKTIFDSVWLFDKKTHDGLAYGSLSDILNDWEDIPYVRQENKTI